MATWQVIEGTSHTLVRVLERQFEMLIPDNNITIQLATAAQFEQFVALDDPAITLFLYHVASNPEMRNASARRLANGTVVRQPLPLELCYIITPWGARKTRTVEVEATATREEHRMIGGILQAFYDHAELTRSDLSQDLDISTEVWSSVDTMQILLESPASEELFRIWDSTEHAYRTSLVYRVRVLGLESNDILVAPPVVDANFSSGHLQ